MSFRFNSLAGRLKQATPLKAYLPQGLRQDVIFPASKIVWDNPNTKPVQIPEHAPPSQTSLDLGVIPHKPYYQKLLDKQRVYMQSTSELVWRHGTLDTLSYRGSWVFYLFAFGCCCAMGWKMSWPKAEED